MARVGLVAGVLVLMLAAAPACSPEAPRGDVGVDRHTLAAALDTALLFDVLAFEDMVTLGYTMTDPPLASFPFALYLADVERSSDIVWLDSGAKKDGVGRQILAALRGRDGALPEYASLLDAVVVKSLEFEERAGRIFGRLCVSIRGGFEVCILFEACRQEDGLRVLYLWLPTSRHGAVLRVDGRWVVVP